RAERCPRRGHDVHRLRDRSLAPRSRPRHRTRYRNRGRSPRLGDPVDDDEHRCALFCRPRERRRTRVLRIVLTSTFFIVGLALSVRQPLLEKPGLKNPAHSAFGLARGTITDGYRPHSTAEALRRAPCGRYSLASLTARFTRRSLGGASRRPSFAPPLFIHRESFAFPSRRAFCARRRQIPRRNRPATAPPRNPGRRGYTHLRVSIECFTAHRASR